MLASLSPPVLRRAWLVVALWTLGAAPVLRGAGTPAAPPLYALLVGGGPDVDSNAAQIEGHVRFVAGLLPPAARRAVLFADGKADRATVAYADPDAAADARRALAVLLADHDADDPVLTRAPRLGVPVEGPARLPDLRRSLAKLSAQAARQPAPLLLYFAGHGTRDEKKEEETGYDLWGGDVLKVRALAAEVARLPRTVPVVLVMAQCFSGAFADLLFRNGDPQGALAERNLTGFFSAKKDREAAGCSTATGREDYQDFSSYFFGALCGRDRFGGPVAGADFDGDGVVSLHEAFCYALIHDDSADTPVCTSDVFLRRFAPLPDATVYGTPYGEVWQAGTSAERAVLDALSARLGLDGERRALAAFDRLAYGDPVARASLVSSQGEAKARLNALRQTALAAFCERWPALRWGGDSRDYQSAVEGVTDELAGDAGQRGALLEAKKVQEQADGAVDNEEAALQRFAGLYEHVVEARHLRARGDGEVKAAFERLWRAEQGVLPTARGDAAAGSVGSAGRPVASSAAGEALRR